MDFTKLNYQPTQLVGTRREPKNKIVHEQRKTIKGRRWLRETGHTDKHSVDNTSAPFIAWDGEGITYGTETFLKWPDRRVGLRASGHAGPQSYVLFGASTGQRIMGKNLGTKRCLDLMLKVERKYPRAIHVGFSIGYDANMIFKDLPRSAIWSIHVNKACYWNPTGEKDKEYRIEWIPRKWLQVSQGPKGNRITCRIYDVWSFFACSFVKALEIFTALEIPADELDRIRSMKLLRGDFDQSVLKSEVVPYWEMELKYLVQLMEHFRELLIEADLVPRHWHGPAALAAKMFADNKIKQYMNRNVPEEVKDASQGAFSAGRIEQFKVGRANKKVYKWDKRSAYPAVMAELPSLVDREWVSREYGIDEQPSIKEIRASYGMYYISYSAPPLADVWLPQPFFNRNYHGGITFPMETEGWYWGPEVAQAMECGEYLYGSNEIIVMVEKSLILNTQDVYKPFHYIYEQFDKRMVLKREGNPAQIGIKLGLNASWGKTAQTVGWNPKEPDVLPSFHQYEWAGYVTSVTRADMYALALAAAREGGLIATETDAVITTTDMPGIIDTGELGGWEKEEYDDIVYLQNGVYWLLKNGEWEPPKLRGMDKGSITIEQVLQYLDNTPTDNSLDPFTDELGGMKQTRFVMSKQAMSTKRWDMWRAWLTIPRELCIWHNSKRVHNTERCTTCKRGIMNAGDAMHEMIIRVPKDRAKFLRSRAVSLPWRNVKFEEDKQLTALMMDGVEFAVEPDICADD
jgi:hypothetical protein